MLNSRIVAALGGIVVLGCGYLCWLCLGDSSVPFLASGGSAQWIIYPKPFDGRLHQKSELSTVFQRSFDLTNLPQRATLSVRAFRHGVVSINHKLVNELTFSERDWKRTRSYDVAKFLRRGDNEISVTVSNSIAPPALWLALRLNDSTLRSDSNWRASLMGATWQKASLAAERPVIRRGNYLFWREGMEDSVRKLWPYLLALLLLCGVVVVGLEQWLKRATQIKWIDSLRNKPIAVLALVMVSFIFLFCNNLPQLDPTLGFDRGGHQEYIDYILKHKRLPLADEGWQMYQPPFFYIIAALISGPFAHGALSGGAMLLLRGFGALTAILHLVLIFLCLRLLFPSKAFLQTIGFLTAAFLPATLYIAHNVTNETLAAMFVTAALYFTLRALRSRDASARLSLAIGISLGLALLTKFSALVAVPIILGALAWPRIGLLLTDRWIEVSSSEGGTAGEVTDTSQPVIAAARGINRFQSLGIVIISIVVVCGWHYVRVWQHFGTPVIGNSDPRLPFAQWQEPGYRTGAWYLRFGQTLVCPEFSSVMGFADGLYSTLWGDGFCCGAVDLLFRPAWNYHLMNLGYLLAIVESLLLVTGALVGLIRFIRKPTAESFLLLGLLFAFVAAIVILSLRVPSYAQINAFYALPALLSLSALAAIGYDFFARRSAVLSVLLRAGIFAWVITVFASFWIRPGNPLNHTTRAVALGDSGKIGQAAKEYSRALKLAPASLLGRTRFSDFLSRTGHLDEARRQAAQAFQLYPGQPEALAQAGISLEFLGRYEDALEVLPQALAKAPDHMLAYASLANSLIQLEQNKRAIAVCEQGLGVDPFNYELHYLIAAAAAEAGDFTNAASHLQFALDLEPDWAQARWLLASVMRASGRSAEAGANYQKLLQSNPNDAKAHFLLAETLRAQGDLRGALDQYRQVLALEPDRVEALNNLAWILATTSKNELRNAKEAVRFAESADKLTDSHQPVVLVTLSVAYAEAGRFGEAVATVEKARQLAGSSGNNELAEKSSQLMELFKAGKPFREAEPLN